MLIIKLDKFYSFLFICMIVSISLVFAIKAEKKDSAVFSQNSLKVPVIMYHHVTKDKTKAGNYTVTTEELENDMKYILSKGYTAVSMSELIDYVYEGKNLPEKSIVITFDDGFESYKELALPIFEKYNIKSSVFIIGVTADLYSRVSDHNLNYSNLNWEAISQLQNNPLCEVHSHTYDLHHNEKGERKGMSRLSGESNSIYENVISSDLTKLQKMFKDKSLKVPTSIAYPYGAYDSYTKNIVKNIGFKVSFTCESRTNKLTQGDIDCLYNMGRFNRESGIRPDVFFKKILI